MDENEESNESSEQFKSSENIEEQSEIQIPENIDINIDETPSDEGEEVSEKSEEDLDKSEEEFSSSDFVPSSRFNSKATVNPFLEQEAIEPVENLERDLRGIPNRQTENTQPQVFNAPQYSSYESGPTDAYETREDTYPQRFSSTMAPASSDFIMPMKSTQINLPEDIAPGRLLNPNETMAWREESRLQSWDRDEDKKYSTDLGRRKRRDDL